MHNNKQKNSIADIQMTSPNITTCLWNRAHHGIRPSTVFPVK